MNDRNNLNENQFNNESFDLSKCRKVHFIGIGGVSMSTLAVIAKDLGCQVSGSDDNINQNAIKELIEMGIKVYSPLSASNIKDPDLVVYTAAVHTDNPELAAAIDSGIHSITRAEYLGYIMTGYKNRIGVSGTHGKSTTTAMLYEIFDSGNDKPTLACGAVLPRLGKAYSIGNKENFIYEACEYTDSFLHFNPTTAIITNIELDHVDYFDGMESLIKSFNASLRGSEKAVVLMDDDNCMKAVQGYEGKVVTVSLKNENASYYAANLTSERGLYSFDLYREGKLVEKISLNVPGVHNAINALCACACAIENGADSVMCREGIKRFHGIGRRFERLGNVNGGEIYIDYAHHPSEIQATLNTARSMEYGRIVGVFQSHTYTRTSRFKDEFASALSLCDKVFIAPIYPAREDISLKTVTEEQLGAMIPGSVVLESFDEIIRAVANECRDGDMVIFIGAGNIDRAARDMVAAAEKNS